MSNTIKKFTNEVSQAEWMKAINGNRRCPLCKCMVEIQHMPNVDKEGHLCHDYCLRTKGAA